MSVVFNEFWTWNRWKRIPKPWAPFELWSELRRCHQLPKECEKTWGLTFSPSFSQTPTRLVALTHSKLPVHLPPESSSNRANVWPDWPCTLFVSHWSKSSEIRSWWGVGGGADTESQDQVAWNGHTNGHTCFFRWIFRSQQMGFVPHALTARWRYRQLLYVLTARVKLEWGKAFLQASRWSEQRCGSHLEQLSCHDP